MKNKLNFKTKLMVFYMWMKQSQNMGIIETCEYCGSTNIKVKHKHSNENKDGYYCATYKCLKCNAECIVKEKWYK